MSKKKHKHRPGGGTARSVTFLGSVLQSIRQHARSSPHAEICGALIGRQSDAGTFVNGAVPGEGAAQGGAHVTFTQEAWVRIHEEKDRKYSGQAIVGWYHSHPGFGVFLSDHDIFIHKNFFSTPGSLAWVYDPQSDEEGCFGWNGGEVRRLAHYEVATEASQHVVPRSEPPPSTHGHDQTPKRLFNIALWRSPRTVRVLLMAILIALLAGLGIQALRRASLFHRVQRGDRQRQINQPLGNDAAKARQDAKDPHAAEATPENGRTEKDSPVRHGDEHNHNGGRDGQ